jgi:protein involved in temperature-dependent protein secretion
MTKSVMGRGRKSGARRDDRYENKHLLLVNGWVTHAFLTGIEHATATHQQEAAMCRRVQCEQCHKPTYAGCGRHVDQVLRGVLETDRCQCQRNAAAEHSASQHRPSAQPSP